MVAQRDTQPGGFVRQVGRPGNWTGGVDIDDVIAGAQCRRVDWLVDDDMFQRNGACAGRRLRTVKAVGPVAIAVAIHPDVEITGAVGQQGRRCGVNAHGHLHVTGLAVVQGDG